MSIPAQQAAKTTRPLMPAAGPAVLLHSLDTRQGVSNIVLAMTRRDVGKPAFSLRKKRFVKTHALSLLGTTRLLSRSDRAKDGAYLAWPTCSIYVALPTSGANLVAIHKPKNIIQPQINTDKTLCYVILACNQHGDQYNWRNFLIICENPWKSVAQLHFLG
jgi:hypothetical protein